MPISKWAIILSPMLIGALRVLVQAGLIMVIGKFIGADPAVGTVGFFVVLSIAFLWGMGFAGYSVAAGVRSGSSQGAQAASFLFFPALFLAPTFVPREAETIETGRMKLTKLPLAKSRGVPSAEPPKTPPNAPS